MYDLTVEENVFIYNDMYELTVEENVFIILTLNIFQLRQVEEKDNNCPKSFS